jgi:2-succinyl-6-hydroxy-2,4-cyclohexadiene-1-carboxylate synthase
MIIFLHGFLGSPDDWNEVRRELSIPSHAIFLPGHGDQPLDLLSFEKQIPEGAILVGYSMGGRLAMHFAKKYPGKIKQLFILSANPGLESGKEKRIEEDQKWVDLLETEGMERFLEKWYQQDLFSSLTLTEALKKKRMEHNQKKIGKVLKTFSPAKMENLWPHLQNFSCPTVFLFGENDIKYSSIQGRLEQNFECITIPKASHPIHLEAPKEVAKAIMRRIS